MIEKGRKDHHQAMLRPSVEMRNVALPVCLTETRHIPSVADSHSLDFPPQ